MLGSETLMSYLPTAMDLATRDDLRDMESRLGDRIDRLDARIDQVETSLGARIDRIETSMDEFNRRMDRFFLALVTGMMGMVATLIAATFLG